MVSGSLALLFFLLGFHGGRQGSGPDRGQSPVEWGDFPSIRSYVRPSICSPLWAIHPGLRPSQPGLRPSQPSLKPVTWLAGWLGLRPGWMAQRGGRTDVRSTDGRTNKRMDGKSPHSTGLCPLSGPLSKKSKVNYEVGDSGSGNIQSRVRKEENIIMR